MFNFVRIKKQKVINMEEVNNLNSKILELQQRLKNLELAVDLYETDLYKIDKRLETIEKYGKENND